MRHCLMRDSRDDPRGYRAIRCLSRGRLARSAGCIERKDLAARWTRLVMLIETERIFSFDKLVGGSNVHPRVAEWNAVMAIFQQALPNASTNAWQPLKLAFNMQAQMTRANEKRLKLRRDFTQCAGSTKRPRPQDRRRQQDNPPPRTIARAFSFCGLKKEGR
jgi:L-rhamnose mutarotase